jgi:hypothetical protein
VDGGARNHGEHNSVHHVLGWFSMRSAFVSVSPLIDGEGTKL